jgi:hypothetical protein
MIMSLDAWPGFGVVLEGFRVLRRQPLLWPAWIALSIGTLAVTLFASYGLSIIGPPASSPAATSPDDWGWMVLSQTWRPLASLPAFCFGYGLSMSAYSRAVLQPNERERSYIRLGATELWTALAILGLWLTLYLIELAFSLSSIVLMRGQVGVSVTVILLFMAFIGGTGWVCSQLWLGPADILSRGVVDLKAIWRLGSGRRARLFWAFVVASMMAGALYSLGELASAATWAKIEHRTAMETATALLRRNDGVASPWRLSSWACTAVFSVFGSVGFAVLMCPAARLYASLNPKVDEVF